MNTQQIIKELNASIATEWVCSLRYRLHSFMAEGLSSGEIAEEFMEHAEDEAGHADQLAQRVAELGGVPQLDPAGFAALSHVRFLPGNEIEDMIQIDLEAEQKAVDLYKKLAQKIGMSDPTTRRLIEEILAKEEEHAYDLFSLLNGRETEEAD